MLDIHTHILPGMDDGSKSPDQSLQMLEAERRQGAGNVVLSSHFYPDRESPGHFLKRRAKSLAALDAACAGRNLPRRIPGAEVAYFSGMSRAEELDALCIGDTRAMLIEMPFCRWNRGVMDDVYFLMRQRGIQPIIAHVERYMRYQPSGTVSQMREDGVWIQVNAPFFLSWRTSLSAMGMMKRREIDFIGSDCHNMEHRPPELAPAIEKIRRKLGARALTHLERMESLLLEGE